MQPASRSRRAVGLAMAIGLVVSTAACSDDEPPTTPTTPTPSTAATVIEPAPAFEPGAAQWTAVPGRRTDVTTVSATSILTYELRGGPRATQRTTAVYSRTTGKELWTLTGSPSRQIPGGYISYSLTQASMGTGGRDPVLVPFSEYTCDSGAPGRRCTGAREEHGLEAFDQSTGRPLWRWSTGAGNPIVVVAATDADATVVSYVDDLGRNPPALVGLDTGTGAERWRTTDDEPYAVGHGRVVVTRGASTVVLDETTGEETWVGADGQVLQAMLDDVLLVSDESGDGTDVVDLASGATEPFATTVPSQSLEADLLVWYDAEGQHTLADGDREPATVPTSAFEAEMAEYTRIATSDDYVFHLVGGEVLAVGRNGKVAGTHDVDVPIVVGDDYVLANDTVLPY
ncbi:PQQ-binding-like beta-propeller repeat protein [Nocardioides sp.]|uniref:outer membrane protein assembly factor BamB family protein n=1 Tax=Nocardioides sp. TaxID=35761 RepID=UPI0027183110|nr:PQQ-binding-like beta-propeller repeat protein [Nocardioides sp.]MDO9456239.1 PQQ-binding-like beta-propeller repeat protein [Nocardioides sp.]